MRQFRNLFSAFVVPAIVFALFTLPLQVSAKTTPAPAATTAPAPTATDSSASTSPSTPVDATAPAAPEKTPAAPLRAKLIDVTDVSTSSLSKGSLDVYMSLTDNGKLDDALVNAETTLSDKISLVTVKDKKETEGSLHVDLPMGKAVKLDAGDKFVRISGIEKSLKDGDKFQLILHFMRAPNVTVDVVVHKKSGWF